MVQVRRGPIGVKKSAVRRAWEGTKKWGKRAAITGTLIGVAAGAGRVANFSRNSDFQMERFVQQAQKVEARKLPSVMSQELTRNLKHEHLLMMLAPTQRSELVSIVREEMTQAFEEDLKRDPSGILVTNLKASRENIAKKYGKDVAEEYERIKKAEIVSGWVNFNIFEFGSHWSESPKLRALATTIPQERIDVLEKALQGELAKYKSSEKKWVYGSAVAMAAMIALVGLALRRSRRN